MNNVLIVAGKELRDGLRNRWLLAITVVFAGLALGIAYFGAAASGKVGFHLAGGHNREPGNPGRLRRAPD